MKASFKLLIPVFVIAIVAGGVGLFYQKRFDKKMAKVVDEATWGAKQQFSEMAKELKGELGSTSSVEFTKGSQDLSSRWIEIEKKCRNSVVQVRSNMFEINWAEPFRAPETGEGVGSGFIINSEGDVMTNFHVVGNSVRIQLQIPCLGKERIGANVIGVSPERDIALLRIDSQGIEKIKNKLGELPYIEFGPSDSIKRGTEVMTLGFPLAKDHIKSTQGIVSGWEKVRFGERDFGQICLETTAPINPGSSGGPALSIDGKVIGINFAGAQGAQNVGFIIPADEILRPIKDMYNTQLLRKIKIGCVPQPSNETMNRYLGNPEHGGFYVTKVLKDTVAHKYGLKEGDVVFQINGHDIDRFGEVSVPWNEDRVHFTDFMNRFSAGDKLDLVVYRSGSRKEVRITLEEPENPPRVRIVFPGYENVDYEIFGGAVFMEFVLNHIGLSEKNPRLVKFAELENRDTGAIVVTHVMPTSVSHAMRGVIAPGVIVDSVNGNKVSSLSELREQIKNSLGADFLRIKGDDQQYAIFDVNEVINDEVRLSKMSLFSPDHSMSLKYALKKTDSGQSGPARFGYGQTIPVAE